MPLTLRLLGPLEATVDGCALGLGGPQQRRLLGLLALRLGRRVSLDEAVDAVWTGDPPASATTAVHSYVSRLRALLAPAVGCAPPDVIAGGSDGYALHLPASAVDLCRYLERTERGLRALRDSDPATAAEELAAAQALWRGPLLGDLELSGGLLLERERLAAACLAATDARYDAELALGRAAHVLPELLQRGAALPLHEPAALQLMAALDACGRQADALRVYTEVRRRFREELGVEPGERLRRLHEDLLTRSPRPTRRRGSGLPVPANALVGRDDELAALHAVLEQARLVTVTGPAGAGKTRLAVEVARGLDDALPDGAWLVELSTARGGADVARAVALALGVLEQPQRDLATSVAEAVAGRRLLLVLDNCEHVVGAVAQVVDTLLRSAAQLRVLATSQEALRVPGEHVFRLGPLRLPATDAGAAEVEGVAAGRLFVERARAVQQGFRVTDDNAAAVARVCVELDGLPLALELAAATLGTVDVQQVAERLPDRFALLARGPRTAQPRHRTLQAAVDWSYELLTPPERELFHALSVFAGGFTVEAVEDVCAGDGAARAAVVPLLSALVDKSFVQVDPATGRFTLLETLRLHGAAQLGPDGGADDLRERHARSTLRLCERAAPELRGPDQRTWVARLDAERDNVAAALRWSLETGSAEVGLGVVAAIWPYWWRNGHIPEGAAWARQVLDRFAGPPVLRAAALVGSSHLWWKLGAFDTAEPACAEALEILAGLPEPSPLTPAAHGVLAMVARDRGDLAEARRLLHVALEDNVAQGQAWGEAATLNMLVSVDRDSHDLDVAATRLARSAALFDGLGDLWGQAWSAWLSGRVATRRGDLACAVASLRRSIVLAADLGHRFGVVLGIAGVAGVAAACGDLVGAARMLGATDALEQAMGVPVRAIEREDSAHDVATTRAALGASTYREHWGAGCALDPEAAVEEALTRPLPV